MKSIRIKITRYISTEHPPKKYEMVILGKVKSNAFNNHDTAGVLFALEFAANNQSLVPMRVHIEEAL